MESGRFGSGEICHLKRPSQVKTVETTKANGTEYSMFLQLETIHMEAGGGVCCLSERRKEIQSHGTQKKKDKDVVASFLCFCPIPVLIFFFLKNKAYLGFRSINQVSTIYKNRCANTVLRSNLRKKPYKTWSQGGRTDSKIQVTNFNSKVMKGKPSARLPHLHTQTTVRFWLGQHMLLHSLVL